MLVSIMTVAAAVILAMCIISVVTAARLPKDAQLPMQWDWHGRPTWTAPLWLAVLFAPAFAALVAALLIFQTQDRSEGLLGSVMVVFLIAHVAHLFFAVRHIKRQG